MSSYHEQLLKYTIRKDTSLSALLTVPRVDNVKVFSSSPGNIVISDVNQHTLLGARNENSTVTLPQATAANVGRVITLSFVEDCTNVVSYIGVADGGSTVMTGAVKVVVYDANVADPSNEESVAHRPLVTNCKRIKVKEQGVNSGVFNAGGAEGSKFTFTYYAPNKIFVKAITYVTNPKFNMLVSTLSEATGV